MAPGVDRWLAATLLGSAAIAVAYLPPQPQEYTGVSALYSDPIPEQRLVDRVNTARESATLRLRRAEGLEKLKQRIRQTRTSRGGTAQVLFTRPAEATTHRRIRAVFDSVVSDLGPRSPEVRLVFVVDTAGGAVLRWLPPAAGNVCGVIAPGDQLVFRSTFEPPRETFRRWLAPCAYYASFGLPGREVQAWLNGRRHDLALSAEWRPPATPAEEVQTVQLSIEARLLANLLYFTVVSRGSTAETACAQGQLERCRRGILNASGMGLPVINARWAYGREGYLATLVREMGRDRFARFWRSSLPVDQAFAEAFGIDLGAWTRRWLRDQMGLLPQPTEVRPVTGLQGLLAVIAAVAVAFGFAHRRQVA